MCKDLLITAVQEGVISEDDAKTLSADAFAIELRFAKVDSDLDAKRKEKQQAEIEVAQTRKAERIAAAEARQVELLKQINDISPELAKEFAKN